MSRMALLVAFRCSLIMYNCSLSFIAENKSVVVVVVVCDVIFLVDTSTCVWQVEGTFCVHKPPVLLGYTFDNRSTQADITSESTVQDNTESTYLTMFVTIEPQLAAPEPFREKVCTARYILSCYIHISSVTMCRVPCVFCKSTFLSVLYNTLCGHPVHACLLTSFSLK